MSWSPGQHAKSPPVRVSAVSENMTSPIVEQMTGKSQRWNSDSLRMLGHGHHHYGLASGTLKEMSPSQDSEGVREKRCKTRRTNRDRDENGDSYHNDPQRSPPSRIAFGVDNPRVFRSMRFSEIRFNDNNADAMST